MMYESIMYMIYCENKVTLINSYTKSLNPLLRSVQYIVSYTNQCTLKK